MNYDNRIYSNDPQNAEIIQAAGIPQVKTHVEIGSCARTISVHFNQDQIDTDSEIWAEIVQAKAAALILANSFRAMTPELKERLFFAFKDELEKCGHLILSEV